MPDSRGLTSEITSAVLVNRILERLPDYNPKGRRLTFVARSPVWTFRLELNAISSLPITDRGYETHKSSRVWNCGRVALPGNVVEMFGLRVKRRARSSVFDLGGLYIYFFSFIFPRYWTVNSVDWRMLFFVEFALFFISFICIFILYERNSKMHARSSTRDEWRFSSGD